MKLSTGSILEIPLPHNLGYGYAMFIFVDELLNDKSLAGDMLIIPFKFFSKERIKKLDIPLQGHELTAPLFTFRLQVRGEHGWKIIGHQEPNVSFGFDFKKCNQYNSRYYGRENELTWYLVRDFILDYKTKIDITKNMHLEMHWIVSQEELALRVLFELDSMYDLSINYDEILIEKWQQRTYQEFKLRPLYRDLPKELWGRAVL